MMYWCKYDPWSPCEYCTKCGKHYDDEDEQDPDREYERERDEDDE